MTIVARIHWTKDCKPNNNNNNINSKGKKNFFLTHLFEPAIKYEYYYLLIMLQCLCNFDLSDKYVCWLMALLYITELKCKKIKKRKPILYRLSIDGYLILTSSLMSTEWIWEQQR